MAIAAADILTRINQITQRELTQAAFNPLLLEACNEIASRTGFLRTSQSGTINAGTNTDTGPTDILSDSAVETFELGTDVLDPISFEEWKQEKSRGYAVYNGTIYVRPTQNNNKSYTMWYYRTHGAIGTNLEFPDIYQAAIVRLAASKVYDDFEIVDKAQYQNNLYENELTKLPNPSVGISHGRGSDAYYG